MSRRAIATILVGQSTLLREGLARILIPPKFRVIASGPRIDALDADALAQYDLRLLIIESGDNPSLEIEHIALFKREHPLDRIAILGHRWRAVDIVTAFQMGANVYFAQVTASEEFLKAIELVMLGQTILPSELLASVHTREPREEWNLIPPPKTEGEQHFPVLHKNGSQLSARERCILRSITKGASNKMIAREIDISEATVKVHVKAILRKIGAANRTQAAIWALQNNDKMCPTAHPQGRAFDRQLIPAQFSAPIIEGEAAAPNGAGGIAPEKRINGRQA
jgi:two-component system nitrate/nitrite response regulator NarL